jgi:hypothetical protein
MTAKVNIMAMVCSVIGLLGVFDTVWFYVTGARSPVANVALTLNWPSFALYINVFAPGIILGLGIRSRNDEYRIFGLIASVVWVFAGLFLLVLPLGGFDSGRDLVTMLRMLASDALVIAFIGYSVWQFNVLRSQEATQYFE